MRTPMWQRRWTGRVLSLASILALGTAAQVVAETTPPLTPVRSLESELIADAADGRLDRFSLLEAALIAGGASQGGDLADWPAGRGQVAGHAGYREIFEHLHDEILTGPYDAHATSLATTLSSGKYNCLTATILYVALCDRHEAPIEIVSTSGHIFCRATGPASFDIETTCPDWFRGRSGSASASDDHAAHRHSTGRSISRTQLLGKIYYNRGVAALGRQQFEEAVRLIEVSLTLDPADADARENLLAAFNNWALALASLGQFEPAAALIARGQQIEPGYAPLAANELHVHQRWASQLCEQGEFAAAIALLEAGRRRRPDVPLYRDGPRTIVETWSRTADSKP